MKGWNVVGSVLYGADREVAEFVWKRIPHFRDKPFPFEGAAALGVVRDLGEGPQLIGGVVFNNYEGHLIEMSGAFDHPDWARPSTLRRLFEYPFVQLGVKVMITRTARNNKRARRIDEGVGFKLSGIVPKAIDGRQDCCIYYMEPKDCRFLRKEA